MKIGILTFHRALNYGAVLQCYALCDTLKNMGHDVEVLDYRPSYLEKSRKGFSKRNYAKLSIRKKFISLIKWALFYGKRHKASRAFDRFLFRYLRFSPVLKSTIDIPDYYDFIIFGSDQVWSPRICEGFDPFYWGQFEKRGTRFVTYAASLGDPNELSPADWQKISNYLENFDAISVREAQLKKEIEQRLQVPVSVVPDPTLLANREIFEKIARKPPIDKYVLLFTLEEDDSACQFAERVAKERGCQVVRISLLGYLRHKDKNVIIASALSPEEFLGYFRYADFIVTISFHGTAFSVIFRKDFYTLHSKGESRSRNLLQSVSLEERLVKASDVTRISPVDYSNTSLYLSQLVKKGRDFLETTIERNTK